MLNQYVSDIILISDLTKNQMQKLTLDLNKIDKHLQFTFEFEVDGKLPFLDVLLTMDKEREKLRTSWYRKPTAAKTLLDFKSDHTSAVKQNIVKNMISKIILVNGNERNEKNLTVFRTVIIHLQLRAILGI
ncbi:unnamed protein product [Didymodactylos carnosus]|uniref:Uncharacterized protein n=1 Tax=Didymodactylos carnosus TaxID=1234261 RepID=A0A8S2E906_9BILA|nr:unnamed protein product [Didymodactylos carnosus]CAF3861758.1 unnamed protein product [Didymodactylos carnosus]